MTLQATNKETNEMSQQGMFLPLLPLKNVIILPKSILPIIVGRAQSIKAVEYALKHDKTIFITTQKDPDIENPTPDDVFAHGAKSTILQIARMPNGALKILVEGLSRAKILKAEYDAKKDEFIGVYVQDLSTSSTEKTIEIEALWRHLKKLYE